MSMLLMVKAMKTKVGNPARKLVLLKLADNANDEGLCWPSYQNIADHCEITKRSAMTHISALEEMGLLRRQYRKVEGSSMNRSNYYYLTLDGEKDSLGSENISPRSENGSLGGSENISPRISHSLEPVKEPKGAAGSKKENLDYDRIKDIFNSTMTNASSVIKLTDKRKKLVKKLFDDFELTYERFTNYLNFINHHPEMQWAFERRPKNDGSGQFWNAQTFEYFVSEKCFLNAKENLR
ncbi:MAG: helix-turn-helix domain-containing protein [Colwellia sp.]|nr:helix-turn-helix domain-containing protein [Colwellia sp.]